jgi:hypothetical protein
MGIDKRHQIIDNFGVGNSTHQTERLNIGTGNNNYYKEERGIQNKNLADWKYQFNELNQNQN